MVCLPSALDVIGLNLSGILNLCLSHDHDTLIIACFFNNFVWCLIVNCLSVLVEQNFLPLGTPSLAEPLIISSVLETISRFSYLPTDVEITLEANPTSAETGRLRYFVFVSYFYSIL